LEIQKEKEKSQKFQKNFQKKEHKTKQELSRHRNHRGNFSEAKKKFKIDFLFFHSK
jgi:hypothetical protein